MNNLKTWVIQNFIILTDRHVASETDQAAVAIIISVTGIKNGKRGGLVCISSCNLTHSQTCCRYGGDYKTDRLV
jgi:hypothetical protein